MSERTISAMPTPETDEFAIKFKTTCGEKYWVPVDIARKLERERDEAIRQRNETNESSVFSCNFYYEEKLKAERERDQLKQLLAADSERVDAYLGVCIERDEARESLKHITEYGTEEINAAVELRQKLASALVERDEAQKEFSSIHRWIERNHADGFIDSLTYLKNLERVMDCWYDRLDKMELERDEWKNKAYSHATDYTLMEAKCFRLEQQLKEYDKLKS